jgi:hypothetical protein
VVRIAKNQVITRYRLEGGVLPKSWTTLYHLTRLTKSKIEDLVESGQVTKETKRDEMITLVDKQLGKVEKTKSNFQKLMITREVEGIATDAELSELKETLSKLKWKMKVVETKEDSAKAKPSES